MNLAIIRNKRFCTFKFFIPITLTPEPKELDSDVFFDIFFQVFIICAINFIICTVKIDVLFQLLITQHLR